MVYIHDKQICHFLYLTNYPGELSTELIEVDYVPPVPINEYEFKLEQFKDTLELYYDAGQTVSLNTDLDLMTQRFEKNHLKISSVKIEGFCSVEGDSSINEKLHQQRTENILNELTSLTESDASYYTNSSVAWDHFYQAVQYHPKWKFLFPFQKLKFLLI